VRGVKTTWFRACAQTVLVLISLAFAGCGVWGSNVVKVRVIFAAPSGDRQVTNLSAVVGRDKYSWPNLNAGTERNINLVPGAEDDRQLFLSYTFNGEQRYWEGPKFDAGTGYEMEITIDGSGHASSRHCILPCTLSRSR